MQCPKCGSENVTSSHRRGMEKVFQYFFPRVPYRCKECWTRFWKFDNPLKSLASKLAVATVILLLVGGVWFFTRETPQQPDQQKHRPLVRPIRKPAEKHVVEKPKKIPVEQPLPPLEEKPLVADRPETVVKVKDDPYSLTGKKKNSVPPEYPANGRVDDPAAKKASETELTAPQPVTKKPAISKADAKKPSVKHKKSRILKGFKPQTSEGKFKLSILSDGPIREYKSFTLAPPPKIVLDMLGKWKYSGRSAVTVKSDMVKRIRVGEHSDKIRLVIDLKGKRTPVPIVEESPDGLILTITK